MSTHQLGKHCIGDCLIGSALDGTLIKMFLGMQGAALPPEQQEALFAATANYPAYSNGITLGGHGVRPKEEALGATRHPGIAFPGWHTQCDAHRPRGDPPRDRLLLFLVDAGKAGGVEHSCRAGGEAQRRGSGLLHDLAQHVVFDVDRDVGGDTERDGIGRTAVNLDHFACLPDHKFSVEGVVLKIIDDDLLELGVEALNDVAQQVVRHGTLVLNALYAAIDRQRLVQADHDGEVAVSVALAQHDDLRITRLGNHDLCQVHSDFHDYIIASLRSGPAEAIPARGGLSSKDPGTLDACLRAADDASRGIRGGIMLVFLFYNVRERRLRCFWRLSLHAALFLIVLLLAGVVAVAFGRSALSDWLASLADPLLMILTVLLAAWVLDRRPPRNLGLSPGRESWAELVFGLAVGAIGVLLVLLLARGAGWAEIRSGSFSSQSPGAAGLALCAALLLYVTIGIGEELLFRGYWLRNMAEGFSGALGPRAALCLAVALTSLLFGSAHLLNEHVSILAWSNTFVAGIGLATSVAITGRVAMAVGFHTTWNTLQSVLFGLPVSGNEARATILSCRLTGPELWAGGEYGLESGLLGTIGFAVLIPATFAWVKLRTGRVRWATGWAQYEGQARDVALGPGRATPPPSTL